MADALSRRNLLKVLSAVGLAGTGVFSRALETLAADAPVTPEMIERAEWISGLTLTAPQRALLAESLGGQQASLEALRSVALDNAVEPAFRLHLLDGSGRSAPARSARITPPVPPRGFPAREDDLAFAPLLVLGALLRAGKVSSLELTRLALRRLAAFDPVLSCVVTVTEELALRQARAADRELAAGRPRGPLHGIPWAAKDLLAVPGYPTTWGAGPFRQQTRPETATVAARLEDAGAVLVAKTAVGELAWGDVWYGGTTKNPWKPAQGSSGSSAGSASAVAAGLVPFAIGTETWGSIVSPATRCGASGLRPTFGRVSRYGAMALSWTMDKIGPLARNAEDLAVVFDAIHGADAHDPSSRDAVFAWPPARPLDSLRIGVVESLFDEDYTKWADEEDEKPGLREWQAIDRKTLETLRGMGLHLEPLRLPEGLPVSALSVILTSEAAAAFDDFTRKGETDRLVRQVRDAWPTVFRQGHMIPASDYVRANRIRTLLFRQLEAALAPYDAWIAPTYGGDVLLMTNLTGHPAVVVPNGFRPSDGTPTSLTILGRLDGEATILALAQAFQKATDFHTKRPPLKPQPR